MATKKKTTQEVMQEKSTRMMNGVALWTAFYRNNPQRFCKDYLNVHLKLFQKIILYAMMHNYYFIYIAARGQGKTFLTALFCVVRCILFPGTQIVVCSGTRSQGSEVLLKIKDIFCKNYDWGSANLNNEIKDISIGANKAEIEFKNGSVIRVATASDSARGMRANVLITDEFRIVDLDTINTVLRKFLTAPREPGYLRKPEYAHLTERNVEIYMSSAWYKSHWSFSKVKSYFANMMDDSKKYFICSLPYQISILENLLSREQVEDEMSEMDFDPIKWSIEMEALFFGDTDGAFFTYDDIEKRRTLNTPFYHLPIYNTRNMKIPDLQYGERRILSVDVALLASKKHDNDASALMINRAIPTSETDFVNNYVYIDTHEGLTTDDLGIIVMRTYYKYKCTDLVLDCNGLGIGVYDFIIKDQYDSETGDTYKALCSCNDLDMAARCKVKDANKVVWCVKASASFNTEMCVSLRNGIQNGKINILKSEFEAEEIIKSEYKGYTKLSPREQAMYKISYAQTSLLINELINLEHTVNGTNIKITEKSGMRKDRYSSMGYNYWCIRQIMKNKKPKSEIKDLVQQLTIRRGVRASSF